MKRLLIFAKPHPYLAGERPDYDYLSSKKIPYIAEAVSISLDKRGREMRVGVIADDLTGANDTAIQFTKQGMKTLVLLDSETISPREERYDVIVLDTDSRSDPEDMAYNKVRKATKALVEIGIELFYKKIDSTLRGNIGSELDAVMDELNLDLSLLIPAFPSAGRITVEGYQFVHGTLLEDTEAAHDPFNPVRESHVPTIIGRQTRRKIGHIPLAKVKRDSAELSKSIRELRSEGVEIVVFDSTTREDLEKIASLYPDHQDFKIVGGPGGFAEELSKRIVSRTEAPTLTVAGSLSQVTLAQVERLRTRPMTQVIELDIIDALKREGISLKRSREIIEDATRAISKGYDLIIRPSDPQATRNRLNDLLAEREEELQLQSRRVTFILGQRIKEIVEKSTISGLILTGGDTARGVCKAMDISALEISGEVPLGIPIGIVSEGDHKGLMIITKAGSFGERDALINATTFLKNEARRRRLENDST